MNIDDLTNLIAGGEDSFTQPGKLPNSLSIPKIRSGLSIHRNPILSSLGQYLLPYSGLGSGIQRVERLYPCVGWSNDQEKEKFCNTFQWTDCTSE